MLKRIYQAIIPGRTSRQTSVRTAGRRSSAKATYSSWRAVSIVAPETSCVASRDQTGYRFLLGEAPTLPLDGCQNNSCHCSYRHHPDRRQGEDRRLPGLTLSTQLFGEQAEQSCRRIKRGRRREDLA